MKRAGIDIGTDIIVHDESIWADWAGRGMLAIGESYMEEKWDSPHVDEVMTKLVSLPSHVKRQLFSSWKNKLLLGIAAAFNQQKGRKELVIAEKHYNLGNEFFQSWLDPNMQYSCGFWKGTDNLEEAQVAKMRMIGEKLKLEPGMRILDIGCGWGGLGRFLIKEFGVKVTGVSVAEEQIAWCAKAAKEDGLEESYEARVQSYRDVQGQWDRIICVGMIEHVGTRHYDEFFNVCNRCLAVGGMMLLQTIGTNLSTELSNDRWITRYIFPNSALPSISQLSRAMEKKLLIEDLQNCGPDYDKTVMAWNRNFQKVKADLQMSEIFLRMWEFYLLYAASGFRARKTQLWQFVMTKKINERYDAPR